MSKQAVRYKPYQMCSNSVTALVSFSYCMFSLLLLFFVFLV